MGIFKIHFFPIGCLCCWLLVALSSQILVQVLTRSFSSKPWRPAFMLCMPIWTSLLWLDRIMMFWFLRSLKSDRRHLSELHIPGFGWPVQRLQKSSPGAQGMALCVNEGFCCLSNLVCSCHETCVFIYNRTNNFYISAFYCNRGNDGSLYDCLLDSMALSSSTISWWYSSLCLYCWWECSSLWVVGVCLSYWSTRAWCSWFL